MPIAHQRPLSAMNGLQLKQAHVEAFQRLLDSLFKNHLIYPGCQSTITIQYQALMTQPPSGERSTEVIVDMPNVDKNGKVPGVPEGHETIGIGGSAQEHIGGGANAAEAIARQGGGQMMIRGDSPHPQSRANTAEPIPMTLSGQPMSAGRHDPNLRARSLDQKTIAAQKGDVGGIPSEASGVKDEISLKVPESTRPTT
jgi:hypothetical protein